MTDKNWQLLGSIEWTERTYTPSEAAAISGANTGTQRNWRARNILPKSDGGWSRFTTSDVAIMKVLWGLSQSGVPVKVALYAALFSVSHITGRIMMKRDAVDIKCLGSYAGQEKTVFRTLCEYNALTAMPFNFIPQPHSKSNMFPSFKDIPENFRGVLEVEDAPNLTIANDFFEMMKAMQEQESFHGTLIDHGRIAEQMIAKSPKPLLFAEVSDA